MKHDVRILLALVTVCCLATAAQGQDETITFGPDLQAGLTEAAETDRLVVLYFASPRCSWCRRFEAFTLTNPRVSSLADQYVWVRASEAELPVLMGRFSVGSWPTIVVLNGQAEEVARQTGYVAAEAFRAFLLTAGGQEADAYDPAAELAAASGRAADGGQVSAELAQAVALLARGDRANRDVLLAALADAGPGLWLGLCELMDSPKLATRAAAGGALAYISGQDLAFDPFVEEALRREQVAAWREWVMSQLAGQPTADVGSQGEGDDS